MKTSHAPQERVEGFPYPWPVPAEVHDGRVLLFPHRVRGPKGSHLVLYNLIYATRHPKDRALEYLKPLEPELVVPEGRDEVGLAGLGQQVRRKQRSDLGRLFQQFLNLLAEGHTPSNHGRDEGVQP